jgi:hypothetical protein
MIRQCLAASIAVGAIAGIGISIAAQAVAEPPYASCNEAWGDGKSNFPKDVPGYRKGLDSDGDGIACESGL